MAGGVEAVKRQRDSAAGRTQCLRPERLWSQCCGLVAGFDRASVQCSQGSRGPASRVGGDAGGDASVAAMATGAACEMAWRTCASTARPGAGDPRRRLELAAGVRGQGVWAAAPARWSSQWFLRSGGRRVRGGRRACVAQKPLKPVALSRAVPQRPACRPQPLTDPPGTRRPAETNTAPDAVRLGPSHLI